MCSQLFETTAGPRCGFLEWIGPFKDTGLSFPPTVLKTLDNNFFRLDMTDTRKGDGQLKS